MHHVRQLLHRRPRLRPHRSRRAHRPRQTPGPQRSRLHHPLHPHARRSRSLKETRTTFGYDCVFLDRGQNSRQSRLRRLRRPSKQCRTWPFWPSNLTSRKAWEEAKNKCPGMDKGKLVPLQQVRVLRGQLQDLSGRNPGLFAPERGTRRLPEVALHLWAMGHLFSPSTHRTPAGCASEPLRAPRWGAESTGNLNSGRHFLQRCKATSGNHRAPPPAVKARLNARRSLSPPLNQRQNPQRLRHAPRLAGHPAERCGSAGVSSPSKISGSCPGQSPSRKFKSPLQHPSAPPSAPAA